VAWARRCAEVVTARVRSKKRWPSAHGFTPRVLVSAADATATG
jgi:hypothetical protein